MKAILNASLIYSCYAITLEQEILKRRLKAQGMGKQLSDKTIKSGSSYLYNIMNNYYSSYIVELTNTINKLIDYINFPPQAIVKSKFEDYYIKLDKTQQDQNIKMNYDQNVHFVKDFLFHYNFLSNDDEHLNKEFTSFSPKKMYIYIATLMDTFLLDQIEETIVLMNVLYNDLLKSESQDSTNEESTRSLVFDWEKKAANKDEFDDYSLTDKSYNENSDPLTPDFLRPRPEEFRKLRKPIGKTGLTGVLSRIIMNYTLESNILNEEIVNDYSISLNLNLQSLNSSLYGLLNVQLDKKMDQNKQFMKSLLERSKMKVNSGYLNTELGQNVYSSELWTILNKFVMNNTVSRNLYMDFEFDVGNFKLFIMNNFYDRVVFIVNVLRSYISLSYHDNIDTEL